MSTVVSALIGVRLAAGMASLRLARPRGLASRLGDLPSDGLPLSRPVTVWWNDHHIPFIEAAADADAAVALGAVHAHLRLAQMEVMRRLAHARLAEMLGPAALPLDHGLALLDFPRAVPAILAQMPAWTRAWVEAFAAGITHVALTAPRPPELAMLGVDRERWTAADVLAVGRLASADVNWIILFNMLKLRARADWPELWAELVAHAGACPQPVDAGQSPLGRVATIVSRSGSNAVAVAGHRSASGGGLMAADPHLSLTLPNLWLVAGLRCPSLHVAGLMIPGLPFVAVGRNRAAAWSGTSLQADSSDLFDARRLEATERRVPAPARWAAPGAHRLRETRLGPLVSDCALLGGGAPVALSWMGHRPSDELTGWLGIARAQCWEAFAAAADRLAVPGQHLLYADRSGRIGRLLAARLPCRPVGPPADAVLPPDAAGAWRDTVSAGALPMAVDPPGGVLASANERPHGAAVRVGSFFPGPDRCLRLRRLAAGRDKVGLDDLAALQLDVFSETALDLKDWLAARIGFPELAAWDGRYGEDSRGAAALELLVGSLHRFAQGDESRYWASWNPAAVLRRRLEAADPDGLARALETAGQRAPRWGDIHRLRLGHWLGMLPGLERLARRVDLPAAGGNDTVHKTAHGLCSGRHAARFGANARFLTDTADLDSSRIVLLGGQDGWPDSATFLDQLAPWRAGETIALPLRPETVRATFPHRTILRP
ncbi:MAG: penicillin acylase family protein [Pseudomonadota bacterium]